MATVFGQTGTVSVDDSGGTPVNVTAYTRSIDLKTSVETKETTVMGLDAKTFMAGLQGGDTFSHVMFYDSTTASLMDGRLGVAGTLAVSIGGRDFLAETIITERSQPVTVGEIVMITATHQLTGSFTWND